MNNRKLKRFALSLTVVCLTLIPFVPFYRSVCILFCCILFFILLLLLIDLKIESSFMKITPEKEIPEKLKMIDDEISFIDRRFVSKESVIRKERELQNGKI